MEDAVGFDRGEMANGRLDTLAARNDEGHIELVVANEVGDGVTAVDLQIESKMRPVRNSVMDPLGYDGERDAEKLIGDSLLIDEDHRRTRLRKDPQTVQISKKAHTPSATAVMGRSTNALKLPREYSRVRRKLSSSIGPRIRPCSTGTTSSLKSAMK